MSNYRESKQRLLQAFAAQTPTTRRVQALLRALAARTEEALSALWHEANMPAEACLVAVGGFGRGDLFPHSDVDVLVLLPDGAEAHLPGALRSSVERFVSSCWDAGLEIGSSVRTLGECVSEAQNDVTVLTAMLESRLILGPRTSFNAFEAAMQTSVDPSAFFRAKSLEAQQRHTKFEDTPYALEPNCKESPGGLRDLHVLIWVARAAGLGHTWAQLAQRGLLTPLESRHLRRNEAALKLIRCLLHLQAGRREDRLVFDLQTAVAHQLGLQAQGGVRASEFLMRRYYWAAKAVTQLHQILMLNLQERIAKASTTPSLALNARFLDRGGLIDVVDDTLYEREPQAILETFVLYVSVQGLKGLSARTLRALYNARSVMDAAWRSDPTNRAQFLTILRAPQGQTHAFRLMNQTSVLGRYLWAFRRIVGQMQHDLFHVYTVDQHILMVLRNLRRFFIPEHAHEYPFCTLLAAQFDDPSLLFIAALFHDIGKGQGGDHSLIGAQKVRRFAREHGLTPTDSRLVELLVRKHLRMSQVAQKEDLSDPDVIAGFANEVGSPRTLTALYLLTVADIRGTGPKVWNAWKGKLLEDCYRLTLRHLGGAPLNREAEIEARKQEARQLLALRSALPETEAPLWRTLQLSYFARHDAAELAWHARELWRTVGQLQAPVVRARPSPIGEGLQVLVYTRDVADLFARICGYFDGAGFNILDAKIHTTQDGAALDTFQVLSSDPDTLHRDLVPLVEQRLAQALTQSGPLPEPRRARVSRRVRSFPFPPRVTLRPDERAQAWVLTLSATDRVGLLYAVARVLARHGVNLVLARISTLGERIEDTLLVSGSALQSPRLQLAIETELLDALALPT
ncbi:[protein-PII] uridylyltransferase [Inhella gelatinilytica]|uniref:Bifunctional uridylyltransferase/uridylyl-removing enzyme n=1 Tax=Inhella gelatinilytica TaxID=2795030 RepID=A0A931IVE7_9BURK|nr:[protein-PII] uridylyltransferase [Inhella gelatinilytica]MBH9553507.1 [protein-PII] uridylyltransferase [Inhella gelatinilytica]